MAISSKARVLFDDGRHRCFAFHGLVEGAGVQANQFLVVDGDRGALIDPGGDLTFGSLSVEVSKILPSQKLELVLVSHQDPDVLSAVGRWMARGPAKVVVSRLWERFLPHVGASHLEAFSPESLAKRLIPVADEGTVVHVGDAPLLVLPAHFLHSVGNLSFYDVKSKILFSGDVGASMVEDANPDVTDFDAHIRTMKGFHERYMCSRKAANLWAGMVRELDVEAIVPQHGKAFRGKPMVARFLDWVANLPCGVDLITPRSYALTPDQRAALRSNA